MKWWLTKSIDPSVPLSGNSSFEETIKQSIILISNLHLYIDFICKITLLLLDIN